MVRTLSCSALGVSEANRALPGAVVDEKATTPRSRSRQAAATTPHRRSQVELLDQLNHLFDTLPSSSRPNSPLLPLSDAVAGQQPRTAPLQRLPELLTAFQDRRRVQLLTPEDKEQLMAQIEQMRSNGLEDHPMGVDDVLRLLVGLGVTGTTSSSSSSSSEVDEVPSHPASTSPTFSPPSPKQFRALSPSNSSSGRRTPTSYTTEHGSPLSRRTRTPSSTSTSSLACIPGTSASASSAIIKPPTGRRYLNSLSRSTSATSSPSSSSTSGPNSNAGARTLKKRRTFEDLTALVTLQGGEYLGAALDGPTGSGEGWDAETEAGKVRAILGAKTLGRDRELVGVLAPLTYPQLKAVQRAFASGGGKSLLEAVGAEKAFKGNVEFALRGLLMGALAWDCALLTKALEGATTNDALLIDLLISRSPSSLVLLRAAYSHRQQHQLRSGTSTPPTPSSSSIKASTSTSLDVAVLSAYAGNTKLRKAWEVALQGRWDDQPEGEEDEDVTDALKEAREERRKKLFREDLDQLKVALRRGGNVEIVAKILLARSPSHLHALIVEYRKSTSGALSLSKAIKQSVPAGTLQKLFLHAAENAKNVGGMAGREGFGNGVWRDAKALERAMDGEKGGRRDELIWRLVRLHWARPRFFAVQQAYKQKYRKSLFDRLHSTLPSGAVADLSIALVKTASAPEPAASPEDEERLANPSAGSSPALSVSSLPSPEQTPSIAETEEGEAYTSDGSGRPDESGELEADGEMSDPPSPRSPPVQSSSSDFELDMVLGSGDDEGDELFRQPTPVNSTFQNSAAVLPLSPSAPELQRSSSGFEPGHAKSSSLSSRQRSAPLESVGHRPRSSLGHRPPSSLGGSVDSTKLSSWLRHCRPIAPSRAKRRQSERPGSEEPLSPSERAANLRSPTPSNLSRSTSSNGDSLASSQGSSHSVSIGMGNRSMPSTPDDSFFGSPPTSIDTTSFHHAPVSPTNLPSDRSTSSFFPGQSPGPASPPAFDLTAAATDFFSHAAPDSPDKYLTTLRRQGSSISHLSSTSGGEGPASMFSGEGGMGLPSSIFERSPAHGREGSNGTNGGGEQVQQLLRHANELMRKLKETEGRLQVSSTAYEEQVSDLEGRLEEARAELHTKRREDKELRSTEKEHLAQINLLEANIAKLTTSLERSRESYDSMKRNYTATCEEGERLRALVAETRRENRAAEEELQQHALQVQQFERDRDLLQQTITRLEEDLGEARRTQETLDDQKQENLVLKETIDKLRFDIDEMRSAASAKSGFLDHSVAPSTPNKSLAESLSRSLGREIASQMAAQESDSSEGEETEGEEDVDDIIVTTHRRIKKRSKKTPTNEPVITHVETTTTVCDADVQTDVVPSREMDIQTDLSAVNIDLITAPAVEPEVIILHPPIKTQRELQEDLAKGLGVNFELVKQFVDASKSGKATKLIADAVSPTLASPRRSGRWRQRLPLVHTPSSLVNAFPLSARPYVAQILDSSLSFVLYSATLYLLGVVSGSRFLPLNHHHTFAPFQIAFSAQDSTAYNAMNWEGLAPSSSGNGLAPEGLGHLLYELVWSGVRTARRIPV